MGYPRIVEGHPAFALVEGHKRAGRATCDSVDHNSGCTNPICPVWGINAKDADHLIKLVQADLRYLRGRKAPKRGGDANAKKIEKRAELLKKLLTLKEEVST